MTSTFNKAVQQDIPVILVNESLEEGDTLAGVPPHQTKHFYHHDTLHDAQGDRPSLHAPERIGRATGHDNASRKVLRQLNPPGGGRGGNHT